MFKINLVLDTEKQLIGTVELYADTEIFVKALRKAYPGLTYKIVKCD